MARFGSKQPYEEYYVAFDFTNLIGSASIASASVIAYDSSMATKTSIVTDPLLLNIDTPDVNVWVRGGVTDNEYQLTCRITTNSVPAEHYEMDATLPVAEL